MPALTRTILSAPQTDDEEKPHVAGLLTFMLPAITVAGLLLLLIALLLATTMPLRVALVVLFVETEKHP